VTAIRVFAAVALALVLQSVLTRFSGGTSLPVDLALVAVVWVSLQSGRVAGLFGGTLAGLAQDAMGGGVIGLSGLAKSVCGFVTGLVGTQFIVTQTVPRFLVFAGATALNAGIFIGLSVLLGLRRYENPTLGVAIQATVNAVIGVLIFKVVEFLPGARERWRARRVRREKRRF
jgi:rod shape-determining protein MreD